MGADAALWERAHEHFSVPELAELGYFSVFVLGRFRWLRTLGVAPAIRRRVALRRRDPCPHRRATRVWTSRLHRVTVAGVEHPPESESKPDDEGDGREHDEPEPYWQDSEVTSDDDVERDTYGPARQRELKRELGDG
jgi:hypothetical protein